MTNRDQHGQITMLNALTSKITILLEQLAHELSREGIALMTKK